MARTSKWRKWSNRILRIKRWTSLNEYEHLNLHQSCSALSSCLSPEQVEGIPNSTDQALAQRKCRKCSSLRWRNWRKLKKVKSWRISRIGQAMLQDWRWKAEPWLVAGAAGTLSPCPKVEPCTQCAKMIDAHRHVGCLPANSLSTILLCS
jgi:hypothetical protein